MKNRTSQAKDHGAVKPKHESPESLKQRYGLLRQRYPQLRMRNAAAELGVPEGVLLATQLGEGGAVRLADAPEDILRALLPVGQVVALTRNEWAVHERVGVYSNASFFEHGEFKQGLFVNADIDLRLFMNHWRFCFAVAEETCGGGVRRSLQFFDQAGSALHKVYLTERSNESAYRALVARFRSRVQPAELEVEPYEPKAPDRPDGEIDWAGLRAAWGRLKDTNQFFPMLRRFKVGREQALRRIGEDFARRVTADALRRALRLAGERACPITVLVGNRGCIQSHNGTVSELAEHGPWYNVLDPKFNLHVREDRIASAWVTRKPGGDSIVTALEFFDDRGEAILTLSGRRRAGLPEQPLWRDIVRELQAMVGCAGALAMH